MELIEYLKVLRLHIKNVKVEKKSMEATQEAQELDSDTDSSVSIITSTVL